MRPWISNTLLSASLMAASLLSAGPAVAQGQAPANPSVDQIIKALTPTGDVSKAGTRGIRLSPPVDARPPAQEPVPAAAQTGPVMRGLPSPSPAAPATQTPALTAAAAAPAAATPTVATPAAMAPTINLTVNFATGSADLTPQAIQTLDALGTALASPSLADYRFRIEGHTDTVGTRELNHALSERRARAVVAYIRGKFQVAGTRLEAVGMGESRPLVPTADQVDEPRNRRVQVTNIGG